jgi:dolichyl-phosphate-mannose--protein O-mannosyl transferase
VGIVLRAFWWSRVSAVSPRSCPWQITLATTGVLVLACAGAVAPLVVK